MGEDREYSFTSEFSLLDREWTLGIEAFEVHGESSETELEF